MAKIDHRERAFESLIVEDMTSAERDRPWLTGDPRGFDAELALLPAD
jgi:hypothetical protein